MSRPSSQACTSRHRAPSQRMGHPRDPAIPASATATASSADIVTTTNNAEIAHTAHPLSLRRTARPMRSAEHDRLALAQHTQPRRKRPRVGGDSATATATASASATATASASAPSIATVTGTGSTAPNTNATSDVRSLQQHPGVPWRDDSDGHLVFKLGDGLYPSSDYPHGRYKILSSLGEGTFGKVVECWDRRQHRRVAVKIVRSISKYREAALLEIDVLVQISVHDPGGVYHCVKLFSWFEHQAHVCMVFEKLGPSLYEHLRKKRFKPFSIDEVRNYAAQLLESVAFVHSLTLIHTDLKPENILLIDTETPKSIKLIDFGSATFQHQHHSQVVSTRHYRAPEVILGLGWTYPCDLWSVGCILVELYTGQALFQTHENLEHLAMMSVVLGPIPQKMIRRANSACRHYFQTKRTSGTQALNWPQGASSKASLRSVKRVRSLADMVRPDDGGTHFLDLLRRLLAFEPETRCTSEEALSHPFFMQGQTSNNPINNAESDYPPTSITHSSGSSAPAPAPPRPLPTAPHTRVVVRDTDKHVSDEQPDSSLPLRERRSRLRSRSRVADQVVAMVGDTHDHNDRDERRSKSRSKTSAGSASRRRRRASMSERRD